MCGIAGFIDFGMTGRHAAECLSAMIGSLSHRGPDDEGAWFDSKAGLALGHRRLSIVDLSHNGHQPMASSSDRYYLSFNGEIYNFRELRKELECAGYTFRSSSDTEVMLAAFEQWGIEDAVKRFVGMFAFALWDAKHCTLSLVRDRLGEKPLYYGWIGGVFLFGSELKALQAHPVWQGEIDRDAFASYMRYGYVPAPYSIYKGINKLEAGMILTLRSGAHSARSKAYWSSEDVAEAGAADQFSGSDFEAVEQLDRLLSSAVNNQMTADVPLGAFLSGGIDSTLVASLMQKESSRPLKTFTIGFAESAYDEAMYAKAIARRLGAEHTELYVTPEAAMEVIPKLASVYDEPFADSSQIPTLLVSQLAKRQVTVSLSGDGADELFFGYARYEAGRAVWSKMRLIPVAMRCTVARLIKRVPSRTWNNLLGEGCSLLSGYRAESLIGDRLHSAADVLTLDSRDRAYRRFLSHCKEPVSLVSGSRELPLRSPREACESSRISFSEWMMRNDILNYLPDDVLVKLDRASMASSLESRLPFMDHRVVEFAWRLPMSMKRRNGTGKWILRELLSRYVPKELFDRPKQGFAVPIGKWLRGPLREWAESLLDEKRLREGLFNSQPIRSTWEEHLSGRRNWQAYLWNVLMAQQWLEQQSGARARARCVISEAASTCGRLATG